DRDVPDELRRGPAAELGRREQPELAAGRCGSALDLFDGDDGVRLPVGRERIADENGEQLEPVRAVDLPGRAGRDEARRSGREPGLVAADRDAAGAAEHVQHLVVRAVHALLRRAVEAEQALLELIAAALRSEQWGLPRLNRPPHVAPGYLGEPA